MTLNREVPNSAEIGQRNNGKALDAGGEIFVLVNDYVLRIEAIKGFVVVSMNTETMSPIGNGDDLDYIFMSQPVPPFTLLFRKMETLSAGKKRRKGGEG